MIDGIVSGHQMDRVRSKLRVDELLVALVVGDRLADLLEW